MDLQKKIQHVIAEYALNVNNKSAISKKGGNCKHLCYTDGKEIVITTDIENIDINDKQIRCNPEFAAKIFSEIRFHLDTLIDSKIKEEGFVCIISNPDDTSSTPAIIDESVIDKRLTTFNAEEVLLGKEALPDLNSFDTNNKLYLCMGICEAFASHVRTDPDATKLYASFADLMLRFSLALVTFSIRNRIGLELMIDKGLDDDKTLSPMLVAASKLFEV